MTKRQIPIGDPRIRGMNDTQWVFELEAMNKEDSERYKDIQMMADIVREQVAGMLGLNLCPVQDEATGLLRMPSSHEIMPLALMTGRDDVLTMIKERHEELATQEEVRAQLSAEGKEYDNGIVELSPEELEAFMDDPGDVEFDSTPEDLKKAMGWGDGLTQVYLENLVLNKDDIDEGTLDAEARTIGQARADIRGAHAQAMAGGCEIEEVDIVPMEILSDRVEVEVPSAARPAITVESD